MLYLNFDWNKLQTMSSKSKKETEWNDYFMGFSELDKEYSNDFTLFFANYSPDISRIMTTVKVTQVTWTVSD